MSSKYKKIGEILAATRREQHKSLKEVAEVTKIRESYLEAVEAGEPQKLPSEPYFNLFARSYAQYLGIDTAIFDEIEATERSREVTATGEAEIAEDESRQQAKSFGRSLIFIVIVIVILFAALIAYNQWVVERPIEPQEGQDNSAMRENHEAAAPEVTVLDRKLDLAYEPYRSPEELDLVIRAKQDVWMMVIRDGDTVLNRQLTAGDVRKWEAAYRFVLTIGISTAVELTLNGRKLPPLTEQAQTITGLEINQVNYHKFLAAERMPQARVRQSPVSVTPAENIPKENSSNQRGIDADLPADSAAIGTGGEKHGN